MSTTTQGEIDSLMQSLQEKMLSYLNSEPSLCYEALQYNQSFIARKKKILGTDHTSTAVFCGAALLAKNKAASSAGVLLKWFIEEGAGLDYPFKLRNDGYCDVERLINFLKPLPVSDAAAIADVIYNPFHLLVAKASVPANSRLSTRINDLEIFFAGILLSSHKWLSAFKSFLRLRDLTGATQTLKQWSEEGYKYEQPIFFARALLYLLSEGKAGLANELLPHFTAIIKDDDPKSSYVAAVWHLSVILTELASLPPMPRVDKAKLFGIIYQRYQALILHFDIQLAEIVLKAGESCFGYQVPGNAGPNPLAMLQSLLGSREAASNAAAAPAKPAAPAFDIDSMLKMMNAMQGRM